MTIIAANTADETLNAHAAADFVRKFWADDVDGCELHVQRGCTDEMMVSTEPNGHGLAYSVTFDDGVDAEGYAVKVDMRGRELPRLPRA